MIKVIVTSKLRYNKPCCAWLKTSYRCNATCCARRSKDCLTGITFTNLRPVDTELGKDVNNMMDSNEAITVEL